MVRGEEPDLAIHEELRGVFHALVTAMNSGQYDQMLPYLTENVEATSITQETMSGRAGMPKYFQKWSDRPVTCAACRSRWMLTA